MNVKVDQHLCWLLQLVIGNSLGDSEKVFLKGEDKSCVVCVVQ